jgi:hypothetical protein
MLGFAKVSSKDELAPYIYYHSEALNAIVIERADGSDSRAIARNLMPPNHEYISGPGWSPSGQWLAWTSTYGTEYYPGPKRIWVISADGNQRLTFLDPIENVVHASWSPSHDYLLIMERLKNNSLLVWLVDVTRQRITASVNIVDIGFGAGQTFWSKDGTSVQIDYPEPQIIHIDGRVEKDVPPELPDPLAPTLTLESFHSTAISPDGQYEFLSDTNPIPQISKLKTKEVISLQPFNGAMSGICDVDWHLSSRWLLITYNRTYAGGGCSQAGKSVVSADGTIQRELGPCNITDNFANWLPENVIPYLAHGQPTSVLPDPIIKMNLDGRINGVRWDSNGVNLAVYSDNRDGTSSLSIWNTSENTLTLIEEYGVNTCPNLIFTACNIIWDRHGTQVGLTGSGGTQILDTVTSKIVLSSKDYLIGFGDGDAPILVENANGFDYDPANQWIASINRKRNAIDIYSRNDSHIIAHLNLDEKTYPQVSSVAFVPNTKFIAFVGNPDEPAQGTFLWDFDHNKVEILPKLAIEYLTNVAAFDSHTVIGYGGLSLLYFWDVEKRTVVARLNRYVDAVDVTSDLTKLVTGSGNMLELWNYRTIINQLSSIN